MEERRFRVFSINVLFKIVKKLKDKGVAIIYISHRMSDLDAIVDNIKEIKKNISEDTQIIAVVKADG